MQVPLSMRKHFQVWNMKVTKTDDGRCRAKGPQFLILPKQMPYMVTSVNEALNAVLQEHRQNGFLRAFNPSILIAAFSF